MEYALRDSVIESVIFLMEYALLGGLNPCFEWESLF